MGSGQDRGMRMIWPEEGSGPHLGVAWVSEAAAGGSCITGWTSSQEGAEEGWGWAPLRLSLVSPAPSWAG